MAGVNKVILLGRLGKDPESRSFQNGGRVVSFSVATSDRYKDRDGAMQERTTWHNIVIFNEKLGEIAEKYLRKGSEVYVEGQLETRKWADQQGQDRYSTEIVLRQFRGELSLIGGRRDGDDTPDDGGGTQDRGATRQGGGYSNGGGARQASGGGGGGGWDRGGGGAARPSAPAQRGGGDTGRGGGASNLDDDIPFGPEWR